MAEQFKLVIDAPQVGCKQRRDSSGKAGAVQENAGHQRGVVVRHLVDVSNQTKAELCVTVVFSELWFLSIPKSLRHVPLDDQLIHPKDLAVDLFQHFTSKVLELTP